MTKLCITILLTLVFFHCKAIPSVSNLSAWNGFIYSGYVNDGMFLNFMGPNMNVVIKETMFAVGMLPSLRFKKDRGSPKNSLITPTLGIGLSLGYKGFGLQIPLYYNPKSLSHNGNWHIGIGFGYRLRGFRE